jgi:hypothetical protein
MLADKNWSKVWLEQSGRKLATFVSVRQGKSLHQANSFYVSTMLVMMMFQSHQSNRRPGW